MKRTVRVSGLFVAALFGFGVAGRAGTVTWGNSVANWGTPGNWVGGQLPDDVAAFPSVAAPAVKVAPDLSGNTFAITNLTVNNGGTAGFYTNIWATGGGKLILRGATGLTGAGGGRTWCYAGIGLGRPDSAGLQDWNVGDVDFKLFGDLSGTGTVRRTSSGGYLKYRRPEASFRGNVVMTNICNGASGNLAWWFMTNAASTVSFGRTADGSAPGTIIMGTDKWFAERLHRSHTLWINPSSSSSGPADIQVAVANPFTILRHGASFSLGQSRTNSATRYAQLVLSGRLLLQGPLQVTDTGGDMWYADSDSGYGTWRVNAPNTLPFRLFSGGVVVTQAVPAQACIRGAGARNFEFAGAVSDGSGPYGNPLMLSMAHGYDLQVQSVNAHAHGTVIDATAGYGVLTTGRIVVNAGATLGTGPVTVTPGGRLKLAGTGALPAGQTVAVQSSPLALGMAAVAFDDGTLDGLVDASSSGVFGLSVNSGANLDALLGTTGVGNGRMFLGSGGDSATYRGNELKVGTDGVYRLCGGGAADLYLDRTGSTAGVLVGTNRVQIGSTALNAGGRVLLSDANTFAGKLTVTSPYLSPGNATALFWGQPAPDSPLGAAAGDVELQGGRLRLYPHASVTSSVVKASLTYTSLSMVDVRRDTAARYNALKFSGLTRQNRGIMLAGFMRNQAQGDERIVVTADPRPAMNNAILDPYFLAYYATDGNNIAGYDFATYDATADANGERGFGRFTAYDTSLPTPGTGTEKVAVALNATLAANSRVYALKVTGAGSTTLSGAGMTITNEGGGVILQPADYNGTGFNIQPNITFLKEAVIFAQAVAGYANIAGKITARSGLTKGGAAGLNLNFPTNDIAGPITVNQGELRTYWDRSNADIGGLGDLTNSVYLNGGQLSPYNNVAYSTLASSRSVTLGPLGGIVGGTGFSAGKTELRCRFTGPGALFLSAFGEVWDGRSVQIYNPGNDHEGGTVFIATAVFNVMPAAKLGSGRVWCPPQYLELWLRGNENLVSPGGTYCPMEIAFRNFVYWPTNAPVMGSLSGDGMLTIGDASFNPARATTLTVGRDNGSATWYGIIAESWNTSRQATGHVVKDGTGTWTVYGRQEYRGQTTVTNGTLQLMGSVAGNLDVGPAGVVGGHGQVNGNIAINGGTLDVTLSSTMQPLRATGSLSFGVGSDINITVAPGFDLSTLPVTLIDGGGTVAGVENLAVPAGFLARASGADLTLVRPIGTQWLVR